MPTYDNPPPPEGINNSERRPLREFLRVTAGVILVATAVAALLAMSAQWLARMVPMAYEVELARPMVAPLLPEEADRDARVEGYLQQLVDRLAGALGLPPETPVRVHYIDDDTVNAIATLGGNVLVYRGLLERLPHENALAMVLSHELVHVRRRDPLVSMGRGVVIAVAAAAVAGVSGSDVADHILGETGLITELGFTRQQERAADADGLAAVVALYGHAGGAADLYRVLRAETGAGGGRWLQFLQSHPDIDGRIDAVAGLAGQRGWPADGPLTPLPDGLLQDRREPAK